MHPRINTYMFMLNNTSFYITIYHIKFFKKYMMWTYVTICCYIYGYIKLNVPFIKIYNHKLKM